MRLIHIALLAAAPLLFPAIARANGYGSFAYYFPSVSEGPYVGLIYSENSATGAASIVWIEHDPDTGEAIATHQTDDVPEGAMAAAPCVADIGGLGEGLPVAGVYYGSTDSEDKAPCWITERDDSGPTHLWSGMAGAPYAGSFAAVPQCQISAEGMGAAGLWLYYLTAGG